MERVVSGPDVHSNPYQNLQDSITPRIESVISGFDVGIKVDLKDFTRRAPNAEYNPRRFSAVVMRIREPTATALLFPSGKVIIAEAKSENDSKLAGREIVRIIQKLGYTQAQLKDWKVVNMVGMIELPFKINLSRLQHCGFFPDSRWEPDMFPAFTGKILKPKMTLLVFASGKVIVVGFKKSQDLDTALHIIFPVLIEFKRSDA